MSFVTADMVAHVTGIVTNGMTENRLIMGGIGLVLLIRAFRLFIAMGNRKQEQPAAAPRATSALILSGDNGSAFITLAAVDSMVQRHCRANPKVKAVSYTHLDVYKRQGLACKAMAALCAPLGGDGRIPKLLGDLSDVYNNLFAAVTAVALMFIISAGLVMAVGNAA